MMPVFVHPVFFVLPTFSANGDDDDDDDDDLLLLSAPSSTHLLVASHARLVRR